jgi:hypothetical protein
MKTPCIIWAGALDRKGYAAKFKGRRAARAIFEAAKGPIPPGLVLDHLCHTYDLACLGGDSCPHRACVNPEHLEPVTSRENTLRGRTSAAANAAKTHCPQGHPYDEVNTYVQKKGSRVCRVCLDAHRRAYWLRNREVLAARRRDRRRQAKDVA